MLTKISTKMQPKILTYPFDKTFPLENCVLIGGCFDLLHYGHLDFLKSSAELGQVIVALESDNAISQNKGTPPIHTQLQRAEILAALTCVAKVVLLPPLRTYEDYLLLVRAIHPKFLAITQGDPQIDNKRKQADAVEAQLVVVNKLVKGLSSSLIRAIHL